MRFLRQSLVGLVLASLTVALLLFAVQSVRSALEVRMADKGRPTQARERVFAVNVVPVHLETVIPVLEAFGQVQSRRTLELRAAVGGRVIWLADEFEEGGAAAAGADLVRIDPADAQSALDRAGSDLLDAHAEERDASRALKLARDELAAAEEQAQLRERAFTRQKDLAARGVATAASVETAELAAASARQSALSRRQAVAQAEARVDQAATRLSRAQIAREQTRRTLGETTLSAPFFGTLSGVSVVEGRLVSVNEKLASLVDPARLEVAFRVSTAQYVRLLNPEGRLIQSPVRVTLDVAGVDLMAEGRISRDSAGAGEGQSGRVIYARLAAAPGFKPGDFVRVEVDEPQVMNVARLPASSLGSDGTVLVLGPENRLESLDVELVRRQGDDVLLRGHGLNGRDVVTGRTPLLGPGIRVRPLRSTPEAQDPEPEMVELTQERRARLVAFVEGNRRMPKEDKARVLNTLDNPRVPARLVRRIESRMGG